VLRETIFIINPLPWEGCGWMGGGREGFLHLINPFPREGIAQPNPFKPFPVVCVLTIGVRKI